MALSPFVKYQGKWYRRSRLWGAKGIIGPAGRFTWAEYACSDGAAVPTALRSNAALNARNLNNLRRAVAKRNGVSPAQVGIKLNSGYRTPSYNHSIHGATNSQHLYARASDVQVFVKGKKVAPSTIAAIAAKDVPTFAKGGIGWYDKAHGDFTHLDVRPNGPARWKNG